MYLVMSVPYYLIYRQLLWVCFSSCDSEICELAHQSHTFLKSLIVGDPLCVHTLGYMAAHKRSNFSKTLVSQEIFANMLFALETYGLKSLEKILTA